jgi:hypothetical protein
MSQFKQRENVKFCQKLGKSASEMFQVIKQAYSEEALGRCAVFKWQNILHRGETVWKMMIIPVGQERSELNQDPRSCNVAACHTLPNGR